MGNLPITDLNLLNKYDFSLRSVINHVEQGPPYGIPWLYSENIVVPFLCQIYKTTINSSYTYVYLINTRTCSRRYRHFLDILNEKPKKIAQ